MKHLDDDLMQVTLKPGTDRGYDFVSDSEIVALKQFQPPVGIMSIYLDVRPETLAETPVLTRFKDAVKAIRTHQEAQWNHDDKVRFNMLVEALEDDLREEALTPHGRTLVLFAAPSRIRPKRGKVDYALFKTYYLPDAVPDLIEWGQTPVLTPLLVLRDAHPQTGLMLFNREEGRFFLYHLGEVEEYNIGIKNEDDSALSKASTWHGYGEHNHQQWQKEHQARYFRNVAAVLSKVAQKTKWEWIVLASPDIQEAKHLYNYLPDMLKERVIGEIALPMAATITEIRDTVKPIVDAAEAEEEKATVQFWQQELAKPDGLAVSGVADVVEMTQEYRIETLIYSEGFIQPGWQCSDCGSLVADILTEKPSKCPYCDASYLLEKSDIIGELALKVMHAGGTIEVVQHAETKALVDTETFIGAVLRY